jgi:lipoate-protein ligase A
MSGHTWRLIMHGAQDGATNMALDQAIMEAVAQGCVPPTLRFYSWQPACLSLGYTQPVSDVDRERLVRQGWHLVRRLTGGRAILHADELTYSIALDADDPLVAGGIVESYRRLSSALLNGLHSLGAFANADKRAQRTQQSKGPVCFETPSHYEITFGTQKLIGSAQVRKFGAVLQHGTLPLTNDITRICDALVFSDDGSREAVRIRVRERATTLEAVLDHTVSWEQAAQAMTMAFQDTFGLEFIAADEVTREEQERASELRATQYATEEWNERF